MRAAKVPTNTSELAEEDTKFLSEKERDAYKQAAIFASETGTIQRY